MSNGEALVSWGSTPNVNVGRVSGGQRKCGSRDEKEGRGSSGAQPVVWDDPSPGWSFFHQKKFFITTEKYSWEWVSFFWGWVVIAYRSWFFMFMKCCWMMQQILRWFDSYWNWVRDGQRHHLPFINLDSMMAAHPSQHVEQLLYPGSYCWMEEFLHHFCLRMSGVWPGFIHLRCCKIDSINSSNYATYAYSSKTHLPDYLGCGVPPVGSCPQSIAESWWQKGRTKTNKSFAIKAQLVNFCSFNRCCFTWFFGAIPIPQCQSK